MEMNKTHEEAHQRALDDRHRSVALWCAAVVALMVGASYAAVPIYRMFCQVTGFAGTTQRAVKEADVMLDRTITIRFDANTRNLAWQFEPEVRTTDLRIGQTALAFYRATNTSDRPLTGTATFNVTPEIAGAYFNKIQCFCFTEQELQPGETAEMPVTFFVDPGIVEDKEASQIGEITLSYTFHPVEGSKSALSRAGKVEAGKGS